ncbi:hypothetical protein DFH06DRAFT_1196994 [Mycena polygramma]|nr:hypothetical protein DFH06DRAFT_1196994 [Mycena polygramma]
MFKSLVFAALAVGAFAAPTSSSSCPPRDDSGGVLVDAITEENGQFLDCTYQNAGLCTYFAIQGSFSSGSSVCPDAAIASSSGSDSGGSSTSSGAAQCVATDDAGSALQTSGIGSDGFVSCTYQAAGTCEYFSPGGQFSAGSSICPDSITPGGSSASTGSSSNSSLAQCVGQDDAGSALQSSGTTADGFVSCTYQTGGTCEYFSPGGQFSSGSSTCPDGITPASTGTDNSSSSPPPSGILAQCATTDDAGSTLQSSSTTADGFVICSYQTAGTCEYFSPGGQFSSGSSTCPDSITPGSSSSSSLTSSVGSFLADSDGNSTSKPTSGVGVQLSQPVVIALLTMNAILVIAVLVAGAVWVFRRHTNKRASSLKGLYSNANAPTTVPLTHGATENTYYDKPRGGFDA